MSSSNQVGIYGKLPLHGDFVYRNLRSDVISMWDEWLQGFVAASREQLKDAWLDTYLTSPVWRFSFSSGILDQHAWLGIFLPCVDRVGRYFPISVLMQIPQGINQLDYMSQNTSWFEEIEALLISALNSELDVDELHQKVNAISVSKVTDSGCQPINFGALDTSDQQSLYNVFPQVLDNILMSHYKSYSAWTTLGSDRVRPCFTVTQNLPKLNEVTALIDGRWSHWNWPQAYNFSTS